MMRCIKLSIIFFMLIASSVDAYAEETLSWQDCIAESCFNNPDLISACENINVQQAGKSITASGLFPQVGADGQASRSGQDLAAGKEMATANSFSYGVNGSQLIFDGFKTINDVNAASENIKASQQNYRFVSSDVRLNLRTAFVNLLRSQELIRVAEEIVAIRKSNLDLIALRYQSGLEHKGALLTAEANLAGADSELSQAKRDVVFSQRQLTKELGRRELKPMFVRGDFIVQDTAKDKPDLENIVKTNPSVLEAAARTNFAQFNISSAYGNFAPSIYGTAGAGRQSIDWPPDRDGWNVGVSANWPIFEGGLRVAEVSQAKALHRQAQSDERSIRDAALVTLELTWSKLQNAMELVSVAAKTLEATQERSKIAQEQYSTGFITFDNWIIIEDDLVRTKRAFLEAQANALFAEANWKQAKGETLEYAQK